MDYPNEHGLTDALLRHQPTAATGADGRPGNA
jgi:hypothetical protein